MQLACVLISDIAGSTQLYETKSNEAALGQISLVLKQMRQIVEEASGQCVKSQGDDVLSFFSHPEPAFQAALTMIHENWPANMSVHVGMSFGEILSHEEDIYGGTVNTAARLASLAKPGEILLGDSNFDELHPASKDKLLMIGELQLRGKNEPTRIYSCSDVELSQQTTVFPMSGSGRTSRTEFAELAHQNRKWQISEGETLTIGRSEECDIVLDQAWVSRKHAALSLRRGQLEFTDHSSAGSVLKISGGEEFNVHRRTTMLSGDGVIYLGTGAQSHLLSTVSFTRHALRIKAPDK